jgi:mono/diheme cytochrome c family protein
MSAPAIRNALLTLTVLLIGAAPAGVVSIKLPPAIVPFKAGPGVALANANCLTCHSAAYVYTQPRMTAAQWTAEVTKMKNAYGAPIAPTDIAALAAYLVTQDGKP